MDEQKSQPLTWNDQELTTFGDIARALGKLTSPDEARKFMAAYREVSPYADQNVGYISGYEDTETMQRIQEWCEVEHPVFGRSVPTPKEAVAAGQAVAAGAAGGETMMDGAARDRVWSLCWAALGFRVEEDRVLGFSGDAESWDRACDALAVAALALQPSDLDALHRVLFGADRDQEAV